MLGADIQADMEKYNCAKIFPRGIVCSKSRKKAHRCARKVSIIGVGEVLKGQVSCSGEFPILLQIFRT